MIGRPTYKTGNFDCTFTTTIFLSYPADSLHSLISCKYYDFPSPLLSFMKGTADDIHVSTEFQNSLFIIVLDATLQSLFKSTVIGNWRNKLIHLPYWFYVFVEQRQDYTFVPQKEMSNFTFLLTTKRFWNWGKACFIGCVWPEAVTICSFLKMLDLMWSMIKRSMLYIVLS